MPVCPPTKTRVTAQIRVFGSRTAGGFEPTDEVAPRLRFFKTMDPGGGRFRPHGRRAGTNGWAPRCPLGSKGTGLPRGRGVSTGRRVFVRRNVSVKNIVARMHLVPLSVDALLHLASLRHVVESTGQRKTGDLPTRWDMSTPTSAFEDALISA